MSLPNELLPVGLLGTGAAAEGYAIERSVRFNSADSAYLSRTPASAGNRKTWTWAGWVKRSAAGLGIVFYRLPSAGNGSGIAFTGNDTLVLSEYISSATVYTINSSSVFRDFSAWYHIVAVLDTSNATNTDRLQLYVNGERLTSFGTATYPSQDYEGLINQAELHTIGRQEYSPNYAHFNGYLADVHFIDGQALDPTSFGEFDDNGIWQPIEYTGTYGTNGFHLDFSDNSTAAALGTDSAGSNDWTVNNISVAAGAGNDSLVDVPTNGTETDTGLGNQVRGNYATLNPLQTTSGATLSNGNLDAITSSTSWQPSVASIYQSSGKWYAECTITAFSGAGGQHIGIVGPAFNVAAGSYIGYNSDSYGYRFEAVKYNNGTPTPYGTSYTLGDTLGIAMDLDAGTLTYYKNGVSQGVAFTGLTGPKAFAGSLGGTTGTYGMSWNFGQRPFAYTAPSGFKALNTASLPAPVITKPSEYMDVKLYTGNGSTQTISGLEFSPDLVWIKIRSDVNDHKWTDTVRGATNYLESNNTGAEATQAGGVTAFNSDGFDVGNGSAYNSNNDTYVAWTWDAGSSTVSNTDGSITSSVRANPSAGFSIVSYTGTGSLATVGHGLGVAPEMVIFKNRDRAEAWPVYHAKTGATHWSRLDGTNAATASATFLNNTAPTSSVITINTWVALNGNNEDIIAYCFAPVAGYSAFGSYTGNGSADGPFVYTGFRPKWLLIKNSSNGGNWNVFDSTRSTYNATGELLIPNLSNSEYSQPPYNDFLSNGFKLRTNDSGKTGLNTNQSGHTYVFAAFAENPLALNARAR